MKIEISSWWKSKVGSLPEAARRAAKCEVVCEKPLTLRQQVHHFLGVSEEGSQLVEMAIVAPILLVIITGMASFGMALYSQQQLGFVTAQTVQSIATGSSILADPCATAATDIANGLKGWNPASFQYTLKVYTTSTASATFGPTTGPTFSCVGAAADMDLTSAQFQPVILTVTYPFSWFPIMQWSRYGNTLKPAGSLSTTQTAMNQ